MFQKLNLHRDPISKSQLAIYESILKIHDSKILKNKLAMQNNGFPILYHCITTHTYDMFPFYERIVSGPK